MMLELIKNRKVTVFLLIYIALFPLVVLTPFWFKTQPIEGPFSVLSYESPEFVDCEPGIEKSGYIETVETNQCVMFEYSSKLPIIFLVSGLVVLAILALVRFEHTNRQTRKLITLQLLIGILVVLATVSVYLMMRPASQGASFFSADLQPDGSWELTKIAKYGLSLTPSSVLLFSLAYLISPFVRFYNLFLNRGRLHGVKKSKLFE